MELMRSSSVSMQVRPSPSWPTNIPPHLEGRRIPEEQRFLEEQRLEKQRLEKQRLEKQRLEKQGVPPSPSHESPLSSSAKRGPITATGAGAASLRRGEGEGKIRKASRGQRNLFLNICAIFFR